MHRSKAADGAEKTTSEMVPITEMIIERRHMADSPRGARGNLTLAVRLQ